jgi:serine/threonine-protein kinase
VLTSPSFRVGRFQAETLLGAGGPTETYRARRSDPRPEAVDERFALKLLRDDRGGNDYEVAAKFVAAARRLQEIAIPGIVPMIEVGAEPGEIFAVSELLRGSNLATLRAKAGGLLPAETAARLGMHVAERLDGLHRASPLQIVHGGLSPENVFVMPSGDVVLLDCGIQASIRYVTETAMAKWLYVAPELLDQGQPSAASDLYSLGALLYFVVTGQPPFVAETRAELKTLMAKGARPLPGAPAWLAAPVRHLLAFLPDSRPASAAAIVAELREALRRAEPPRTAAAPAAPVKLPESPRTTSVPVVQPEGGRRSRVGIAAALAIVVIAALAVAGMTRPRRADRSPNRPAPAMTAVPVAKAPQPASGPARAPRAAPPVAATGDSPGRLRVVTNPPLAAVWLDGAEQGLTPTQVDTQAGTHKVVLVLPGHALQGHIVDTSASSLLSATLPRVTAVAANGTVRVDVVCRTVGKYPVFIDEQDTGQPCPAHGLRLTPGPHVFGVFVIPRDQIMRFSGDVRVDQPQPVTINLDY